MFVLPPRQSTAALVGASILSALVIAAPDTASAQCSMCVTALEQNPEVAAGFNRAILFLLAMPYAVFGSLAGYVLYSRRRRTGAGAPVSRPARAGKRLPLHDMGGASLPGAQLRA